MLADMTTILRGLAWSVPWVLVLACTTAPGTPPPSTSGGSQEQPGGGGVQTPGLEGRTFLSQKLTEGGKPRPLVEGTQLLLSFEADSRFGAHAGCNSMSGSYAITDGKLVIPSVTQTKMACEGRLEHEAWYSQFLKASPSITIGHSPGAAASRSPARAFCAALGLGKPSPRPTTATCQPRFFRSAILCRS